MYFIYCVYCDYLLYYAIVDSIKSLDLVCMQQLDKKVNIIPVIAKADTISRTELQEFKGRVRWWLVLGRYLRGVVH